MGGVEFLGVGGSRSREAGVHLVADSSRWGAIGIVESLMVAPRVIAGYRAALKELSRGVPGVLVPIDYGYMNVRLARAAKLLGWRVAYFIPPGSWRRDRQGADIPRVSDLIVTPFSWSAELLGQAGGNAVWLGHPLAQMVAEAPTQTRIPKRVAVLPGSRSHEIARNVPAIAEALAHCDVEIEVAAAPGVDYRELRQLWRSCNKTADPIVTPGDTYGVLMRGQAAVICSGTATLESALCGCPCVVVYRGSKTMEIEYRIRRPKFEAISLPNILLCRPLLPELIQWDATPAGILARLTPLLTDTPERQAQLEGFEELRQLLGPGDAITQAAAQIAAVGRV